MEIPDTDVNDLGMGQVGIEPDFCVPDDVKCAAKAIPVSRPAEEFMLFRRALIRSRIFVSNSAILVLMAANAVLSGGACAPSGFNAELGSSSRLLLKDLVRAL